MTINVMTDYNAKNDGVTDDTTAFQNALNAAGVKGDTVYCPPGPGYYFAGHLNIPESAELQGSWCYTPTNLDGVFGTTFLVTENAGSLNGTPFITMQPSSALRGVSIHYPNQPPATGGSSVPIVYPYTIYCVGSYGMEVENVEIKNPYQAIFVQGGRQMIRNVWGQPLLSGITIDSAADIIRCENVHFNEYWSPLYATWTKANGTAFIIARADSFRLTDCFAEQYLQGFFLTSSSSGNSYGTLLGCGTDSCATGIVIDSANSPGISIIGDSLWGNGSGLSLNLTANLTGQVSVCGVELGLVDHHKGSLALSGCRFAEGFNPNVKVHTGATLVQAANIGIQVANVP